LDFLKGNWRGTEKALGTLEGIGDVLERHRKGTRGTNMNQTENGVIAEDCLVYERLVGSLLAWSGPFAIPKIVP
jgi:hypothetical protein